jgi:hypothetical protein
MHVQLQQLLSLFFLLILLTTVVQPICAAGVSAAAAADGDGDGDGDENIKFTMTRLDGDKQQYEWLSEHVALLRTTKSIYLTRDSGVSFIEQDIFNYKGPFHALTFIVNPVDANIVLFVGKGEDHYIATDMKTLKRNSISPNYRKFTLASSTKGKVKFQFHPTYKDYILALVDVSKDLNSPLYNMYLSKDSAKTWTLIKDNIKDALWSNVEADGYDPDSLLAIRTVPKSNYFALFKYNIANDIFSRDIVIDAHQIRHEGKFTYLTTITDKAYQLHVSIDNAKQFRKVELPDKDTSQRAYVFLDYSETSVFLTAFDYDKLSFPVPSGNVYSSDWTGARFAISLPDNFGFPKTKYAPSMIDFQKVRAMEGVYIANVVSNAGSDDCSRCEGDCPVRCHIATRITFNRGADWQAIEPPNNYKCSSCRLNLFGIADKTPILSHHSAVGIIFATGNVGSYLSKTENLFMSRDAGLTWNLIIKGKHFYEITDNGGLLVIASPNYKTNYIGYSWDQGTTFKYIKFTNDTEYIVKEIHHNKKAPLSKSMMIVATNSQQDSTMMVFADFSGVKMRDCKGYDKPDTSDSDYETFIPHTYHNNKCLLGRIVKYIRRKKDSVCFNPYPDKILSSINCECTYEDFECDYYFVRKGSKSLFECVPEDTPGTLEQIEKIKAPPRRCYGYYNETRGYRKIAGDTCVGGQDLSPIPRQCPSTMSALGVFILLFFLFILALFVGIFLYRNSKLLQSVASNGISFPSRHTNEQYERISQIEDFGLDDVDEEEADEFDESSFNFSAVATQKIPTATSSSVQPTGKAQFRAARADEETDDASTLDQSVMQTISLKASHPLGDGK